MTERVDRAIKEDKAQARYERAAEAVLNDPDLSDGAKERGEEGALFEKARSEHDRLHAGKAA